MLFTSVFRIRIVLSTDLHSRIRTGPGSCSWSFLQWLLRCEQKISLKKSFLNLLLSVCFLTSDSGSGGVHVNADPDPRGPKTSESGTLFFMYLSKSRFYSSCLWMLCLVLKQTGHHQNIRNRRAVQFQCGELILVNIYCLVIISVADPDPHGSAFILVSWIRIQECQNCPQK